MYVQLLGQLNPLPHADLTAPTIGAMTSADDSASSVESRTRSGLGILETFCNSISAIARRYLFEIRRTRAPHINNTTVASIESRILRIARPYFEFNDEWAIKCANGLATAFDSASSN